MTREQIEAIVKYVYDYLENVSCSCEDPDGTCWYHMTDADRISALTRWVMERGLHEQR